MESTRQATKAPRELPPAPVKVPEAVEPSAASYEPPRLTRVGNLRDLLAESTDRD